MTQPATHSSAQVPATDGVTVVGRLLKGFFWIAFAALTLVFLINAGISGYFIYRTHQFIEKATHADATVIRLEPQAAESVGTYPVIQFFDASGNPHEFRSSISSNPPMYEVGEKLHVYYDPANPFDARIDSFFSLWLIPFIFGTIASVILFLLISCCVVALIVRWAFKPAHRDAAANA